MEILRESGTAPAAAGECMIDGARGPFQEKTRVAGESPIEDANAGTYRTEGAGFATLQP